MVDDTMAMRKTVQVCEGKLRQQDFPGEGVFVFQKVRGRSFIP